MWSGRVVVFKTPLPEGRPYYLHEEGNERQNCLSGQSSVRGETKSEEEIKKEVVTIKKVRGSHRMS